MKTTLNTARVFNACKNDLPTFSSSLKIYETKISQKKYDIILNGNLYAKNTDSKITFMNGYDTKWVLSLQATLSSVFVT